MSALFGIGADLTNAVIYDLQSMIDVRAGVSLGVRSLVHSHRAAKTKSGRFTRICSATFPAMYLSMSSHPPTFP